MKEIIDPLVDEELRLIKLTDKYTCEALEALITSLSNKLFSKLFEGVAQQEEATSSSSDSEKEESAHYSSYRSSIVNVILNC